MKKILAFLAISALALNALSAPPTAATLEGNYETKYIETLVDVDDSTIVAATASVTIKSSLGQLPGWEYILVWGLPTKGDADSIAAEECIVSVVAKDKDGTALRTASAVDTLQGVAGESLLPISLTITGSSYDIKLTGGADNPADSYGLQNIYLYARRVRGTVVDWAVGQ